MPRQISIAAVAVCLTSFAAGGAEIMNLGDAAPPLTVSDWVKGKKIDEVRAGAEPTSSNSGPLGAGRVGPVFPISPN